MKFSIVTPAWNVGPWLKETIDSVLSQTGDFDIEYIVVTDPGEDDTVDIAKHYAARVAGGAYPKVSMQVIELEGSGSMYAALNAGFAAATGDVHAWIPGDDTYKAGAFAGIQKIFETFPQISWVKGYGDSIDEHSVLVQHGVLYLYHQPWLRAGVYGIEAYHVNQESVFWRAKLWKTCGPFPSWIKSMGDYWLWLQFAKVARLSSAKIPVSNFRKRPGQDSRINRDRCLENMWRARGGRRPLAGWVARLFFFPYDKFMPTPIKRIAERLYPIFFPRHQRKYIDMQDGVPTIVTAPTFVIRPHHE